jgi:peptidoglycan/LPS O-acetylase OafA/YrhL
LIYRPEVDGLRAIAVIPVIFFHMGRGSDGQWLLPGGFLGVDVFFVISGYLITRILLADLQAGQFSLAAFYQRRARRILPALFLVLAACLPFAWLWMDAPDLQRLGWGLGAVALFLSNILYWTRAGYFGAASETDPLVHTWSLAVEEQFYMLFPLLLLILWRLRPGATSPALLAIAVMSFCFAIGTENQHTAFYWLHTRAWELLAGALLAANSGRIVNLPFHKPLSAVAPSAGLAAIFLPFFLLDHRSDVPGWAALPTVLGTLAVLAFAGGNDAGSRLLKWRPVVAIGLISYSLYLWHQPLFAFLRLYRLDAPTLGHYLGMAGVAVLCAGLSYRLVETPFRNRGRISRSTVVISALCATGLAVICSVAIVHNDGFSNRWPQQHNDLAAYKNYDYKAMLRDRE